MKPLYVKKDGTVQKVSGIGMPATYPAENTSYDNTTSGLSADDVQGAIDELSSEKVDIVSGKGLSSNDYTTAEKTKLAGISTGATKTQASTTNGNIKIDNVETIGCIKFSCCLS